MRQRLATSLGVLRCLPTSLHFAPHGLSLTLPALQQLVEQEQNTQQRDAVGLACPTNLAKERHHEGGGILNRNVSVIRVHEQHGALHRAEGHAASSGRIEHARVTRKVSVRGCRRKARGEPLMPHSAILALGTSLVVCAHIRELRDTSAERCVHEHHGHVWLVPCHCTRCGEAIVVLCGIVRKTQERTVSAPGRCTTKVQADTLSWQL
mmetsp:Transcript_67185/g.155953  ORF Transcript_67185/g.155953 Transcript_67185/m.155953 type:complete len:208 (+) Transcript_67185:191-814(+)